MPNLFTFRGFVIYFWAGDGSEPMHVHVSVGAPSPISAKFWITESGNAVLASNVARFSKKDLRQLEKVISLNHERIVQQWQEMFGEETIFYSDK